jgi:hypothetical protein
MASNNRNYEAIQNDINDVKGIMTNNIDSILQRGERLDDLVDKSTNLETSVYNKKK